MEISAVRRTNIKITVWDHGKWQHTHYEKTFDNWPDALVFIERETEGKTLTMSETVTLEVKE